MVIFYSLCLLVIYLVTVTRRTADARLWLFLSLNFGLERLVIKVHRLQDVLGSVLMEQENGAKNILETVDISEMVNQRAWIVRNSAARVLIINFCPQPVFGHHPILVLLFVSSSVCNDLLLQN